MDPAKPGHPYRDPVDLAVRIARNPTRSLLDEFDQLAVDVRVGLMRGNYDADAKEDVIRAVFGMVKAGAILEDVATSNRAKVAAFAVVATAAGAVATRLPHGALAALLLAGSIAAAAGLALMLAQVGRMEAVARRMIKAADLLEKYVAARDEAGDPPTGIRVVGGEVGAAGAEDEPGASSDEARRARKGPP